MRVMQIGQLVANLTDQLVTRNPKSMSTEHSILSHLKRNHHSRDET